MHRVQGDDYEVAEQNRLRQAQIDALERRDSDSSSLVSKAAMIAALVAWPGLRKTLYWVFLLTFYTGAGVSFLAVRGGPFPMETMIFSGMPALAALAGLIGVWLPSAVAARALSRVSGDEFASPSPVWSAVVQWLIVTAIAVTTVGGIKISYDNMSRAATAPTTAPVARHPQQSNKATSVSPTPTPSAQARILIDAGLVGMWAEQCPERGAFVKFSVGTDRPTIRTNNNISGSIDEVSRSGRVVAMRFDVWGLPTLWEFQQIDGNTIRVFTIHHLSRHTYTVRNGFNEFSNTTSPSLTRCG